VAVDPVARTRLGSCEAALAADAPPGLPLSDDEDDSERCGQHEPTRAQRDKHHERHDHHRQDTGDEEGLRAAVRSDEAQSRA